MHHGSSGSRTTLRSTADCATGWNWATWATTAQASSGKRGSAARLRTTRITAAMPGGPSTAASVKATSPRQRTSGPEGSPARAVAAMARKPAPSAASPGDLLVISPPRIPTEARTGARPRGGNRRWVAPTARKGRFGREGRRSAGLPVLRPHAHHLILVDRSALPRDAAQGAERCHGNPGRIGTAAETPAPGFLAADGPGRPAESLAGHLPP